MENSAHVTAWAGTRMPTADAIRALLDADGFRYEHWSSGPLDVFFAHSHSYNKIIYVVTGAITFRLPKEGIEFTMKVGDRLDLPAGTIHEAVVSTLGVECFEVHC